MAGEKRSATESEELVHEVSAILLDVEGTTSSISFVKDTLFPHVREFLKKHVDEKWDSEEFKADFAKLKEQAKEDEENKVEGFVPINEDTEETAKESLIKNVLWQMDNDRKSGALKQLQGHIWKAGHKSIKGHVYDDVPKAFEQWTNSGKKLYIYSSGSVEAQKLLYGNSVHGDLLKYISGHFDTQVGPKQEADSYKQILKKISFEPANVLFLTDVVKEAEAAKAAGLSTAIVIREGNAKLHDEDKVTFKTIESFAELSFQSSNKRQKLENETSTEKKDAAKDEAVVTSSAAEQVDEPMDTSDIEPPKEEKKTETKSDVPEVESKVEETVDKAEKPIEKVEKEATPMEEETKPETKTVAVTNTETENGVSPLTETKKTTEKEEKEETVVLEEKSKSEETIEGSKKSEESEKAEDADIKPEESKKEVEKPEQKLEAEKKVEEAVKAEQVTENGGEKVVENVAEKIAEEVTEKSTEKVVEEVIEKVAEKIIKKVEENDAVETKKVEEEAKSVEKEAVTAQSKLAEEVKENGEAKPSESEKSVPLTEDKVDDDKGENKENIQSAEEVKVEKKVEEEIETAEEAKETETVEKKENEVEKETEEKAKVETETQKDKQLNGTTTNGDSTKDEKVQSNGVSEVSEERKENGDSEESIKVKKAVPADGAGEPDVVSPPVVAATS